MATFFANIISSSKIGTSMDKFAEIVPQAKKLVDDLSATGRSVTDFVVKADVETAHVLKEVKELLHSLKKPAACLEKTTAEGSTKVNEILSHVEKLLVSTSVSKRVIKNATSHIVGIGASVVNLLNANDLQTTVNCSISILSMLGLESEIALKIMSRFSESGNEKPLDIEVEEQADFGKIAELLTALAGMAGKDSFLPSVLVSFIKNAGSTVRNLEGCKKMWRLLEEILAECGFDVSERMRQLRTLKESFEAVKKDAEDIETRFNVSPSDFLSDVHAKRFKTHCTAVENLEKIILSKVGNDLPRPLVMSITALANQIRSQRQKLALMSASCAIRPCPVGVAIVGESSIGKSMLTETIINGVKKELQNVHDRKFPGTEFAEDAANWSVWFQNTADQYDQGYASQEIHCVDDAFQDTRDTDHLNYIQKISTTPALTYQASLAEKGMPYRSRLVLVSCNKFPEDSATIKSISALKNRFPVYIEASLKEGREAPRRDGATFDPSFDWLELKINGVYVTIPIVIHQICTRLLSNEKLYVQALTNQSGKAPAYANRFFQPPVRADHFATASEGDEEEEREDPDDENQDYDEEEAEDQQEEDEDQQEGAEDQPDDLPDHYVTEEVELQDEDDTESSRPISCGIPLRKLTDQKINFSSYLCKTAQKSHIRIAANAVRLELTRMQDHPAFFECIRNISYVIEDGTTVLLKEVFSKAFKSLSYENSVLVECLSDPEYFFTHVNNMRCHPKFGPAVSALFAPCVVVRSDATRLSVRGVWCPYHGYTNDRALDPTFFDTLVGNLSFNGWMAWSKLWQTNQSWWVKLCLIVVSPLARFALCISKLLGADADTLEQISMVYEMLAPTIVMSIMPVLFAIVISCLWRLYSHVYLYAKGFSWAQVRTILDDFTPEDYKIYMEKDEPMSLLRFPPVTEGRLYIKHNGLCLLCGCPMWKWNGEEFVHVKTVGELLDVPKQSTPSQLIADAETAMKELVQGATKDGILTVLPFEIIVEHIEGSADQANRQEVKRVAKLNKPGKVHIVNEHIEGSADQANRQEVKRVAKLNKPGKINVITEDNAEASSGPRFSRTTKLQDREHAKKSKEIVAEYLKEHERSDKKLATAPAKIQIGAKSKHAQWSPGEVPEVVDQACIDENAKNVSMKIARNTFPIRNVDTNVGCFCVVSGNLALFPYHLAKPGDRVEITDKERKRVLTSAIVRDGVAQWDLSCCDTTFGSTRIDNLFVDDDRFFAAVNRAFIQYFPKSNMFGIVTGKFREAVTVRMDGSTIQWTQRLEVTGLDISQVLSTRGDCGGILCVLNPSAQKKAVAMHTAGATSGATSYATIVTVERWNYFRKPMKLNLSEPGLMQCESEAVDVCFQSMEHVVKDVKWAPVSPLNFNMKFMLDDEESDAQHFCGGSLKYVGDAVFVAAPCSEKTALKLAPFGFPFPDVKKHPSVLTELDPRVENLDVLMKDRLGFPSILMTQIAKYAGDVVDVDCELLSRMVDQLVVYHSTIMSDCDLGVCPDFDSNMWLALNGIPDDPHAKPLAFKASAGLPWSEFGAPKKISLLTTATTEYAGQKIEGKWFDLKNPTATLLYDVTREKLELAQKGLRTHSIWKDCLKDELRSDEKIREGKSRAFTAAPFESVLMMRMLFAKYKLNFTKKMFKLNHALGINPHSSSWSELAALLRSKGNKCLDGDFSSFDGSIPRQFMLAAGDVIIRTIEEVSDDGYQLARRVMWSEIVDTIQCSWSTCYMKEHGNNSGQPLTTPTNSIVVFLVLWYAFCKLTHNSSLSYFLDNVAVVTFGDDNAQNVKDDITDVYHPEAIREEISKIGMAFTSAAKDGSMGWQTIDEIQFLKRKFVTLSESHVVAPLDKESIVQCFNYTLLSSNDLEGWKSTTLEQLLEASLHGQRFYVAVQTTLLTVVKKLRDTSLRNVLIPVLLISYRDATAILQVRAGGVQQMNDD